MTEAWVYILANRPNGTIYVGVTSDLARRAMEHRSGQGSQFTARYGLKTLVYVERHESILTAIRREKTLKSWPRAWKIRLIHECNPEWIDLYPSILS